MAICPECGGRVFPGLLASLKPAANFPCRWCNAVLRWSAAGRRLRDGLLGAGLLAALGLPLWLNRRDGYPLWLESILVAIAAVIGAAWLLGDVIRLHTVRPRTVFPAGESKGPSPKHGR